MLTNGLFPDAIVPVRLPVPWIATTSTSDRTRVAALAWVGKHLGMFTQNIRVSQELRVIRVVYTEDEHVQRSA